MLRATIHKTISGNFNIVQRSIRFKSKRKKEKLYWLRNDCKLENNVIRARTNLINICSYNKFEYFYTQTISSVYSRSDLDSFIVKFNQIVRNLRKKDKYLKFYYVFVPEYHLDKLNWHLHGFLSEGFSKYAYTNKNGFLSLSCFDCLGFNSVSVIRNYDACIFYSCKYITKDLVSNFKKGQRIVYASKGLNRSNVVNDIALDQVLPIHFDFRNEFCLKTTIKDFEYYNLITRLDSLNNVSYYDIK